MKHIAVVTTVASHAEAQSMARALVEHKLVACAQISEIESYYHWQGALQHEPEFRILFKTTAERYAEVERAIRKLHGYELPAIHAYSMAPIYEPYAAWIEGELEGRDGKLGTQTPVSFDKSDEPPRATPTRCSPSFRTPDHG